MLPIYLVAVIAKGNDGWRVLITLPTSKNKATFIRYLVNDLDASTEGDWYVVASNIAGDAAVKRAVELGASHYSLC